MGSWPLNWATSPVRFVDTEDDFRFSGPFPTTVSEFESGGGDDLAVPPSSRELQLRLGHVEKWIWCVERILTQMLEVCLSFSPLYCNDIRIRSLDEVNEARSQQRNHEAATIS